MNILKDEQHYKSESLPPNLPQNVIQLILVEFGDFCSVNDDGFGHFVIEILLMDSTLIKVNISEEIICLRLVTFEVFRSKKSTELLTIFHSTSARVISM